MGCDTRLKLSPGLSVQVTCNKVSDQLYDQNCTDLMLIINSKNDENSNTTDRFCILQHFSGHGILAKVDRLFINPNYIDLKIEKFQRKYFYNPPTSCFITTKKLPQTPPSNSRSFLTNILPWVSKLCKMEFEKSAYLLVLDLVRDWAQRGDRTIFRSPIFFTF